MVSKKNEESTLEPSVRYKKATTPTSRLRQLQAKAFDEIERRIMDGTASSAELLFIAKTASPEEVLKYRNLQLQNELLEAKIEGLRQEQNSNQIYEQALKAFAGYRSSQDDNIIDGEYIER